METQNLFSEKIVKQFDLRSDVFNISASWITDKNLIQAHVDLAGNVHGEALDLCCGTGQIGRALKNKGWKVTGLDISENMMGISSNYFDVSQGKAEKMPFESNRFHLVVCRQSFQFLDIEAVLSEIKRVLVPEGILVLSLTVPFSEIDAGWLYEIHRKKQPLLLKFYTADTLLDELKKSGLVIDKTKTLTVRESINKWMEYAPELSPEIKFQVCSMVRNAPDTYKKLHQVVVDNGEILENWNWIIIKARFK